MYHVSVKFETRHKEEAEAEAPCARVDSEGRSEENPRRIIRNPRTRVMIDC